jgi:RNA polymerase sigma factor (sigma-70 family)
VPGCDEVTDAELVASIQCGTDREADLAWESLIERYGEQLLRYLVRAKGLTSEELQDVAGETWSRAVQLIPRYEDRGYSLFAWLKAIAHRVFLEHFKERYLKDEAGAWRRKAVSLDVRAAVGIEPESEMAGPADQVLRAFSQEELAAAIQEALAEAPPDYRAYLEARYLCDMTPKDIMELAPRPPRCCLWGLAGWDLTASLVRTVIVSSNRRERVMDAADREAVKGLLLEAWIDDLRQDRRPRLLPEMNSLTQEEIAEVMALARWYKGSLHPTELDAHALNGVTSSVRSRIAQARAKERQAAEAIVAEAPSFSTLLQTALRHQGVNLQAVERTQALPARTVQQLETGQLPPHRVPLEKMVALLRGLRLVSERVVTLVRQASIAWAEQSYGQPQTQLGRIDPTLDEEERGQLLRETSAAGGDDGLGGELERIEAYCRTLAGRLS